MLSVPYFVTSFIDDAGDLNLFNWKNNKAVSIFDLDHPMQALRTSTSLARENIPENYAEDIDWLLENFFLTQTSPSATTNQQEDANKNNDLHLIILPSGEACNLNCVYCYQEHTAISRMNEDDAEVLIKFIKKQHATFVELSYFGGEPLLNVKFIEYLSTRLKEENIDFKASITTNGTLLTPSVLDKLYKAKVKSFQITLDGTKDNHNKLRVSNKKSLNSFESTCSAIKLLSSSSFKDISLLLRMNINHKTIEDFREVIQLLEHLIPKNDARFLIFPKPIGDYLSANLKSNEKAVDIHCLKESADSVIRTSEQLLIDSGYYLADALMLTRKDGYSCYAGKKNSFVITPDFAIRKCTVAIDDPINIVGKIENDGELKLNENFELWIKDYSDNHCTQCFLQNTCQGNSCPLANIKSSTKNCLPSKTDVKFLTQKVINTYERLSNE